MNTTQKSSYTRALTIYENMIDIFIRTHDYSPKVVKKMIKLKNIHKSLAINGMEVMRNNPNLEQNVKFKDDLSDCMYFLKSDKFKNDIKDYYKFLKFHKKDYAYVVISKCEFFKEARYFNIFSLEYNKLFDQLVDKLKIVHQSYITSNKKQKSFRQGDLMTKITQMVPQKEVDSLYEIVGTEDNAYLVQLKPVKYILDENQDNLIYQDALGSCFYGTDNGKYLYHQKNYITIYQIKIDILNNSDLTPNVFNDQIYSIQPPPAKKTPKIVPDDELEALFKPVEKCKPKCKSKPKNQNKKINPIIKPVFIEIKCKPVVFKITNPPEIIFAEKVNEIFTLTQHIICNAIPNIEPKIKTNYAPKQFYLTFNNNTTFNNKHLLEKMLNDYYNKNSNFRTFMKSNTYSIINVMKDIHNSNCYTVINHFNLIFKNTNTNALSKTFHANIQNDRIYNITELNVI